MNVQIQPNIIQKFVVVESNNDIFLWGNPNAKFHKDIVQNMQNSGIAITNIKGGAKLKMEKDKIYVWGESSVYGEVAFKEEFEKYPVSENTILVGHSCGCAFLVRWLGEQKTRIKKLILVAPWKIPKENNSMKEKFYTFPIDETLESRVGEIIMFTADNEREDGKKSLEIYKSSLGGRVIELKGRGHYIFGDMGTEQFPELLKEFL